MSREDTNVESSNLDGSKSLISRMGEHKIILAIFNFILTGILGVGIGYYLQTKQATKRLKVEEIQKQIEEKAALSQEVDKAVADYLITSKRIVSWFKFNQLRSSTKYEIPPDEVKAKLIEWEKSRKDWEIANLYLEPRLKSRFGEEIQNLFRQVNDATRSISGGFTYALINPKDKEYHIQLEGLFSHRVYPDASKILEELDGKMMESINKDIEYKKNIED
jgi:hypothetical protein